MSAFSSTALTNLNFTLLVPSDRFTSFMLSNFAPQIVTGVAQPLSDTETALLFTNYSGQVLTGAVQLAVFYFNTESNQQSAFVSLLGINVLAMTPDGTLVSQTASHPGRVVIVAEKPLLEPLHAPSNRVQLLRYAVPGSTIEVQWTTNLLLTNGWMPYNQATQTNLMQESDKFAPNLPAMFFRALRP